MKYFILAFVTAMLLTACTSEKTTHQAVPSQLSKNYPIALQNIAEGVWVHTSNYTVPGRKPIPSNGLIIQDGDELIMVDTAWGEKATESLLEKIKLEIGKPVTKLIITHHHPDRLAGVDLMEIAGADVFTHPLTPIKALKAGFPVPNTSVAALKNPGSRTKVGSVELAYPGPGHAEDNLIVYIPKHKILFGGCAIKGANSNNLGNIVDADIKAWPSSLNWVKATYADVKIIVPGHGKGSDIRLIDKTLGMIAANVNADAKKQQGDPSDDTPAKP